MPWKPKLSHYCNLEKDSGELNSLCPWYQNIHRLSQNSAMHILLIVVRFLTNQENMVTTLVWSSWSLEYFSLEKEIYQWIAQERSPWQCLPHPGHSLLQRNSMTVQSNRCLQGTQSVDIHLPFLNDQKSLIVYIF